MQSDKPRRKGHANRSLSFGASSDLLFCPRQRDTPQAAGFRAQHGDCLRFNADRWSATATAHDQDARCRPPPPSASLPLVAMAGAGPRLGTPFRRVWVPFNHVLCFRLQLKAQTHRAATRARIPHPHPPSLFCRASFPSHSPVLALGWSKA
jgi:hypothetical protein